MKIVIRIFLKLSTIIFLACNVPMENEINRVVKKQHTIKIRNVSFTFPSKGYAHDNRNKLIDECFDAIESNSCLIKLINYNEAITVCFLTSRQEMKRYTGMAASGIVLVEPKILHGLVNEDPKEVKPPIKHELMHMISMTTWGYPGQDSNWMNEGLAALAANNCNGYNDEQIYRYLAEKNMLTSVDSLTASFYKQPEMIAYHQAACIVQYLLANYDVEKFKYLWKQGFASFEKIYSM